MKVDPYSRRQKCRPMSQVSGDADIRGASNESGVIDDGNFWRFEWLLLQKLQR